MAPLWGDYTHLNEWYARFVDRPSYDQAVTQWGDQTSAKREAYGNTAFSTVRKIWNATGE